MKENKDRIFEGRPTYSSEEATLFVDSLYAEAQGHHAVHHPYLLSLAKGEFPNPEAALKDFFFQYLAYSTDFIRYLTATISQLEDRHHRQLLIKNLTEESGRVDEKDAVELRKAGINPDWVQGIPHPELYRRFLDSVGMGENWRSGQRYDDAVLAWKQLFLMTCSSKGPAQALGAIGIGTEGIVRHIYRPILSAIKKFLDVSPENRAFWDLHALIDDDHAETLKQIAVDYARYDHCRSELRLGMNMALSLRSSFFDAMTRRTLEKSQGSKAA